METRINSLIYFAGLLELWLKFGIHTTFTFVKFPSKLVQACHQQAFHVLFNHSIRRACSLWHPNKHICGDLTCYPRLISSYGQLSLMLVTLKVNQELKQKQGYHGLQQSIMICV